MLHSSPLPLSPSKHQKERGQENLTPIQQPPDPLDALHSTLEALQPHALLDVATFEDGHALLELGPGLAFRRDHGVGLLKELRAELFELAAGLRQATLGFLSQRLLAR